MGRLPIYVRNLGNGGESGTKYLNKDMTSEYLHEKCSCVRNKANALINLILIIAFDI